MPQLAIETFVSQYFWLVTILFTFYYLVVTQIIPKFSNTFKTRRKIESLGSGSSDSLVDSSSAKESNELISEILTQSKSAGTVTSADRKSVV